MVKNEREEEVTFLLHLANRITQEDQARGLPRGVVVVVAEGDGTFTNHLVELDDDLDLTGLIGTMEIFKQVLLMRNIEFAATDMDGTLIDEDDEDDDE